MAGVIVALLAAGAFYFYIYRNWGYHGKLVFKLVLACLSFVFTILLVILLVSSIGSAYGEEKDKTLSSRIDSAQRYVNKGDYNGLAEELKWQKDYEEDFDYLWERLEMYACCNRYLIFSAAEQKEGSYGEEAEKYRRMLLSLCLTPEYEENVPYGEYFLKQAGLGENQ